MGVKTDYKVPQRVLGVRDRSTNQLIRKEILFELAPRHHLISVKTSHGQYREYNLFFPWMYFVVDAWMITNSKIHDRWMVAPRSKNGYAMTNWNTGNAAITRIGVARTQRKSMSAEVHKFVFPNMYGWGPCHRAATLGEKDFKAATDEQLAELAVHQWFQLAFNTDMGSSSWPKSAWKTIRTEVQKDVGMDTWKHLNRTKRLHRMFACWESKNPTDIVNMPYPNTKVSLSGFLSGDMRTKNT